VEPYQWRKGSECRLPKQLEIIRTGTRRGVRRRQKTEGNRQETRIFLSLNGEVKALKECNKRLDLHKIFISGESDGNELYFTGIICAGGKMFWQY
jgi:hypothetical protein